MKIALAIIVTLRISLTGIYFCYPKSVSWYAYVYYLYAIAVCFTPYDSAVDPMQIIGLKGLWNLVASIGFYDGYNYNITAMNICLIV